VEQLRARLERLRKEVTSQVWRLGFASRFLFYMVITPERRCAASG